MTDHKSVITSSQTIFFFFFNDTATTEIYTLSLHDALPISFVALSEGSADPTGPKALRASMGSLFRVRSEEHTSELQSQSNLVCRLLLEKKKTFINYTWETCRVRLRVCSFMRLRSTACTRLP